SRAARSWSSATHRWQRQQRLPPSKLTPLTPLPFPQGKGAIPSSDSSLLKIQSSCPDIHMDLRWWSNMIGLKLLAAHQQVVRGCNVNHYPAYYCSAYSVYFFLDYRLAK